MIGVWIGCTIRHKTIELRTTYEELLSILNVKFDIIDKNTMCCGYPLYILGVRDLAQKLVNDLRELFKKYELIMTPCPGCFRMLSTFINDLKIVHSTQFFASLSSKLSTLLKPLSIKVTYHDPCDLGRNMEVYEEPRSLIKLIPNLEFKELDLNRDKSTCCGGGGLLILHSIDLVTEISAEKWRREIEPLNIDYVVTSCPTCYRVLQYGAIKLSKESSRVLEISQLLLASIKGVEPRKIVERF